MFDFRYHALSLIAVFIALAVGLLLGVAIGDSGLVSSADHKIRNSLRQDVNDARRRLKDARARIAQADEFQKAVYPLLVDGQLNGRSVGVVFLGNIQNSVADDVRNALRDTQVRLRAVAATGKGPDLGAAGGVAAGTRYEALSAVPEPDLKLVGDFGFRMGAQFVTPGRLLKAEQPTVFDTINGGLAPVDAVVVVYDPEDMPKGYARDARDRFDEQFVEGLRKSRIFVVGVQRSDADPSRIGWYKDRSISSVDDVDETSGKASLIFALQGRQGQFGRRDGAKLLPDPLGPQTP